MFNRNEYYSQTEVVKKFKVSVKRFKELAKNIDRVNKEVDMGTYTVTTIYIRKEDIKSLNLELRK